MSGINIGLPNEGENPEMPTLIDAPQWHIKLTGWLRFWKSCHLKAGPMGNFCRWNGGSCCYDHCPSRMFEEVTIGVYPEEEPPEPVKRRVKHLEEGIKVLGARVEGVASNQQKVFNNITKELKDIKDLLAKNEELQVIKTLMKKD